MGERESVWRVARKGLLILLIEHEPTDIKSHEKALEQAGTELNHAKS